MSDITRLSPSEAMHLLRFISPERPALLVGSPGAGKTCIAKDLGRELQCDMAIWHPVTWTAADPRGLPVRDGDAAKWLPFGELKRIIEADKPLLVLIDDLGQASQSVQAALMQILLERRINDHVISDDVMFIACTNSRGDKAGVSAMIEPLKGRMMIIHIEPTIKDWIKWATDNNQPQWLITFIANGMGALNAFEPSPEMTNSPTSRNVTRVGEWWNAGIEQADFKTKAALFEGCCGIKWRIEALTWLQVWDRMPNIQLILSNPDAVPVPQDGPTTYAVCGALAKLADADNDVELSNISRFVNKMSGEFGMLFWQLTHLRGEKFKQTKQWTDWGVKNQSLLRSDFT